MRGRVLVWALLAALASGAGGCSASQPGGIAQRVPAFPALPPPVADLRAAPSGTVYFATQTPFDLDVILGDLGAAAPTTGVGTLFLPELAPGETVPAMVLLHGSGGIKPGREMEYGELLARHGIAAFVLDYYRPRGIRPDTPYMLSVLSVTEFDAIADAYAALELLSTHPAIDASQIGLAGFSYGGMAARFAMDARIQRALAPDHPGFAVFVDYYGPCFQRLGTRATNGAPLLTLRGDRDASNDLTACQRREDELRRLGIRVEAHVYPGAGHAWENTAPRRISPDSPYVVGCEVVYDERGHSWVDGQPVVALPLGTPRLARIETRAASGGGPLQACVEHGYLIGHDPETKAKSDADLLGFLQRELGR